ncbi:hypothetical protein C8R43DRAFT_30637 [Mycena crocata]|nr:hypothetical protein C8R43DRAFT_30637 [Mycena crocata]
MLRRRRSLAALIAGSASASSASSSAEAAPDDEDDVPPLPLGLTRATIRVRTISSGSAGSVNGSPDALNGNGIGRLSVDRLGAKNDDNGIIRRVSSLFRAGSASSSSSVKSATFASTSRYKAASSSPDIINSPPANKLVKRPSVKRKHERQLTQPDVSSATSKSLASAASSLSSSSKSKSVNATSGISSSAALSSSNLNGKKSPGWAPNAFKSPKSKSKSKSKSKPLPPTRSSSSSSRIGEDGEDEEDDIRRPSGLGHPTSLTLADGERDFTFGYAAAVERFGQRDDEAVRERSASACSFVDLPAESDEGGAARRESDTIDGNGDGDEGEEDEDDIRRPSGLGRPTSLRAFPIEEEYAPPWERLRGHTDPNDHDARETNANGMHDAGPQREGPRMRAISSPTLLQTLFRLPSSSPSSPSSPAGSPLDSSRRVNAPSPTTSFRTSTPSNSKPRAARLTPTLWGAIFEHMSPADAARAARVSRPLCEGARSALYGVLDLRGLDSRLAVDSSADSRQGRWESDVVRRGGDARGQGRGQIHAVLRAPHLAARVEGVVCDGWPPWPWHIHEIHFPGLRRLTIFPVASDNPNSDSLRISTPTTPSTPRVSEAIKPDPTLNTRALFAFLRAHPTLERLAVVGAEDDGVQDADDSDGHAFLPRLTHLHAPPALSVLLLERIAAAPPFVPPPPPSPAPSRNGSTPDITDPNSDKKGLSAASLALLAPDAKAARRPHLPGWHRVRSHNAEVEALAGAFISAQTAPQRPDSSASIKRIPRKPPPVFSDETEEGEAVVAQARVMRAASVARAVYVQAPAQQNAPAVRGPGARHPLRVLRLVIPRPLYEGGAAAAGGGRVGRAVGKVLARGPSAAATELRGLELHLLCGPRIERRTLEKVLRTFSTGLGEALAAAAVESQPTNLPPSTPSAWPGRGRSGRDDDVDGDVKSAGRAGGIMLLEVRSAVRIAELHKIMHTVLPRYSTLRTLLLTRPQLYRRRSRSYSRSNPPSPRSPSFFFPSPPSTPGFRPVSMHAPVSPSFMRPPPSPSPMAAPASPSFIRAPSPSAHSPPSPSLRSPPSPHSPGHAPSLYASAHSSPDPSTSPPPSPRLALAPPPGLHPPPSPRPTSALSHKTTVEGEWAWEWAGWADSARSATEMADSSLRIDTTLYGDGESASDVELDGEVGELTTADAAQVAAWRRHCATLERVRMVSGAWWLREEH